MEKIWFYDDDIESLEVKNCNEASANSKYFDSRFIAIQVSSSDEKSITETKYYLSNYIHNIYPDDDDICIESEISKCCYGTLYIYHNLQVSEDVSNDLSASEELTNDSLKKYKYRIKFNLLDINLDKYIASGGFINIKIYEHPFIMPENDKFNKEDFINTFDENKAVLLEKIGLKIGKSDSGEVSSENFNIDINKLEEEFNNGSCDLVLNNYKLQIIKTIVYSAKEELQNLLLRNLEIYVN